MGRRRIRNLHALGERNIVGFDPRAERRSDAERLHGIRTVATFDEGMASRPDALLVSTPPDHHYPACLAAADAGLPWFCEAGIIVEGAEELSAKAQRAGIVAAPSCTLRFHPLYQRLERLINGDRVLGAPLLLTFHLGQSIFDWHPWEGLDFYGGRKATGAAREMVPFEFQWLTWVFGSVADVQSTHGALMGLPGGVDDAYAIVARFDSGLVATVAIDVIARQVIREGKVLSHAGTLYWDMVRPRLRFYDGERRTWTSVDPVGPEFNFESVYVAEVAAFLAAIRGESPWPHSYAGDRHLERIVRACELSQASGRRVRLSELDGN
jgi:predicted dehydrogenase